MHYTINKPEHGSQEWLRVRWENKDGKKLISASVAAAVHNEHPYTSSAELAAELLADNPPAPLPPTKDMERGNRMEPMLVQWISETEVPLQTPDIMYGYERGNCRLIATLDAIDPEGKPYEVKSTRKRWTGELPDHWYWQGVQQAMCTGHDQVEWIIFDGDLDMHRYTQVVTSDEKQAHESAVAQFLESIDAGMMPEGAVASYEMVNKMYPQSTPSRVEIGDEGMDAVMQLIDLKDAIKELEKQENELQAQIGEMLKDCEVGTFNGAEIVSWKTYSRETVDTKALTEAHPALVAKFKKRSQYRTMKTKRSK